MLSDPTRVRLLRVLQTEELGVGELTRILQLPQSTVSRHLKVLHDDGWIARRPVGTARLLRLDTENLSEGASQLWQLVVSAFDPDDSFSDDLHRLRTTVALRSTDSSAFFEQFAGRWDELRRDLFGDGYVIPTLLGLLPPGLVVADLGCGTGEMVSAFATSVERAIGVDREPAMLALARGRTAHLDNVEIRGGSLEELPMEDQSLDIALCVLVFHHVSSPVDSFVEIARVLRPGGRLVLLDMVSHGRGEFRKTMGHQHLGFRQNQLLRWADHAGLELERFGRLSRDPQAMGPPLFLAVFSRLAASPD